MNRFKQKTGKRVLSYVLVLALLIPMIPAPVFADTPSQAEYNDLVNRMVEAANRIDLIAGEYGTVDFGNGYTLNLQTELLTFASRIRHDLDVAAAIAIGNPNDPRLKAADVNNSSGTGYNQENFNRAFPDTYAAAALYLKQGGIAKQEYTGSIIKSLKYYISYKAQLNPAYYAKNASSGLTQQGMEDIAALSEDFPTRISSTLQYLNTVMDMLKQYRSDAELLPDYFLSVPCADKTCVNYETTGCSEWTHRLLVPEVEFNAAVTEFKMNIDRDIKIVGDLATGSINSGLWFADKSGKPYYTNTAAATTIARLEAAKSFLEKGGYNCGTYTNYLGIYLKLDNQLSYKSNFSNYKVEFSELLGSGFTITGDDSSVETLAAATLNIMRSGATADNLNLVYDLKVNDIRRYIAQVEALKGTSVPEGGTYTQTEFEDAIDSFLNKAHSDLAIAESLVSGDLDKSLASRWIETLGDLKQAYKEMSDAERRANAVRFFNEGGYAYGYSLFGVGYQLEYKSSFHSNYSSGLFGVMANKANAVTIMKDTAAALQLGNRYMTAVELAEHQYNQSLARLQGIKEDPSGIVTALLNNDQELKNLIADLNTILGSLDDIINTMETLERLGIGKDILDPILSQAGLSYDMLNQLAKLRDTLEAVGIDTSGNIPIEDSLDSVAGSLVGSLIDLAILGANATASIGTESAYKTAAGALDSTYNSLMENAANAVNKLLAPISAVVNPIRPYLGMLNSTVSMVNNVAVLVEHVDKLQDNFTVGGLSKATYTTADTMDDLADFLEAFQATGLSDLFAKLLENSNLGGTVADGTAAMLNQLAKELIKQDIELSGSDFDLLQKTVDELAKRGLENPTALVPLLRASAEVLRRAAELEGGIQDAIDGNYEAAWNTLTKDLGGMISKTVTLWNTIVALYEEPEVQEFAALTMNRQTGELNLDSLDEDVFLQSFAQGINVEAEATFKVLIDPDCSHSEKLARVYQFWNFLKDVKAFVSELEDAIKQLNAVCDWAEENLTQAEAKAFIQNLGRYYAEELRACIKEGLDSSSVKKICKEIEESVSEMRDLLNYIKCTGDLEITATPGEASTFYTFNTNYDALRVRLDSLLRTLGISTGYKVNSPAEQFTVDGNKLIAIGDLEDGQYKVKVAYQMYFAVCDRDFASTLATKWVTVNISGGGEEPEEALTGIEITALPNKISYRVGESLNLTGLQVMAYFDDETAKLLDLADCDITPEAGARLNLKGSQAVTISYGGFSDSFEITVEEANADIYHVRFDTDGGVLLKGASLTADVEAGGDIELPWVEKLGHIFKGWFDAEGTYRGDSGDFYTVRSDVNFYAHWAAIAVKKEFTVTFDPNGGTFATGVPSSITKEEGSTIKLPAITRSGYTFNGWYNGDSIVGKANDAYTVSQNITLTADWSRNSSGGGGGGSTKQILDEEIPLGGIYSLMSLPAEPKDGIVYYVDADGNTVFVPFCYPIGDKIYFLGQVGIEYLVKANPKQFGDITGNWAYDNILAIASREAFQGYPDSSFQPGSPMTRAMLSAVLARMAMVDTSSYKTRVFDDVSPDAWYGPSVAWALEQGIVTGVGGKQFNPNANITRQEFSVMLARFISYMSISLPSETAAPFADEDMASDWAKTAIADMKKYNIVTGRSGNLFDPYSDITRAEITTMLYRLIQTSITYGYENSLKETKKAN